MSRSGCCNSFPAKKPQFFTIILEKTMQDKKLDIPRKFAMKHGSDLPDCITLELPDGAQWKIKLTRTEYGQVWMDQGWLDFVKHYSVSRGHLLIFNPQEVYKFLVVIFDMSGTEIKYPPMTVRSSESHFEREVESPKNYEKNNASEDSECHRSHKKRRADNCNTRGSDSSVGMLRLKKVNSELNVSPEDIKGTECDTLMPEKAQRNVNLHVLSEEFEGGCTPSAQRSETEDGQKKGPYTPLEKAKLLEKARVFQSNKPCFRAVIQQSAVYRKNKDVYLEVPFEFAQKYLTQRNGNVILQNEEGRTWSAKCRAEAVRDQSRLRIKLARGWRYFSADNHLEVGDVCVFEMIKDSENLTLNVVIFRARKRGDMSNNPRHHLQDDRTKQKTVLLAKAQDFKSSKPYFKVIMQSSSVYLENQRAAVSIPGEFARQYLPSEKGKVVDVIIYDEEGRTWSVSYHYTERGAVSHYRFITGWKFFAKDNNLRVGDVCAFEMDNCQNIAFKVIIFRQSDAASCFLSPGNFASLENEKSPGGNIIEKCSGPVVSEDEEKLIKFQKEANKLTDSYPWFAVKMKNSYVQGSCLTVPRTFAWNYIKTGTSTAKLNVGDKSWQVNLINHQGAASRISGGWITFSKENALRPLDICKFELIQWDDCVFRVSILRNTTDWRKSTALEFGEVSGGDITGRRSCINLCNEENESTKVKNEASNYTITYPWFEVEMENACIQGWCLIVPSSFAGNYIRTGASTIKLNVEDKSWRVNLFKFKDGTCKISAGWTAFVRENSLKPKDICKFELIQRNDCFFKVSISRSTSNSTSSMDIICLDIEN